MDFEIRAQAAPWNRGVELLIFCGRKDAVFQGEIETGRVWGDVGQQPSDGACLAFVTHADGARREPSLELTMQAAQALMDDLWNAGLRPTEGTGSAGSLAATERHLKDMQRLAFEILVPMRSSNEYLRSELREIADCLQSLYDLQNGCPLPKYEAEWDEVMAQAGRLLKRHEIQEGGAK